MCWSIVDSFALKKLWGLISYGSSVVFSGSHHIIELATKMPMGFHTV